MAFMKEDTRKALGEALARDKLVEIAKLAYLELDSDGACVRSKLESVRGENDLIWSLKTGRGE